MQETRGIFSMANFHTQYHLVHTISLLFPLLFQNIFVSWKDLHIVFNVEKSFKLLPLY